MNAQVQIIEKDGQPEYAVVPIEFYRRLLALAEDAEDIEAAEQARQELEAGKDELIPGVVAERLLSGSEHPLRVWREYRELTQETLAERAGVGKSYVSQIEAGKKAGSVRVLRALAVALRVATDDLLPPKQ
jgi:DNA-binding XRE family transcriptional regulator